MQYQVVLAAKAKKDLKKIDKYQASLIINWLQTNLENCTNPRKHGKALVGDKSEQWRYRVGNYRILAEINDNKITILVLNIGHRKDIYN